MNGIIVNQKEVVQEDEFEKNGFEESVSLIWDHNFKLFAKKYKTMQEKNPKSKTGRTVLHLAAYHGTMAGFGKFCSETSESIYLYQIDIFPC